MIVVCIVLLWKAALTVVITSLQEGQVLKIINRLSVVPMTLDILQVSSVNNQGSGIQPLSCVDRKTEKIKNRQKLERKESSFYRKAR